MDVVTLLVGVIIGILIGVFAAVIWYKVNAKENQAVNSANEAELKILLAQQAHSHISQTQQSVLKLEQELNLLKASVTQYENALSVNDIDDTQSSFFGEHAGVFLRNTTKSDNKFIFEKSSDAQPKDFANNGSGLFVGQPAKNDTKEGEKTSN